MMTAAEIATALAERINALVCDLLPGGHREGHEWRAGDVTGSPGHSLGVHLHGQKQGIWSDFATGEAGDALDLVRASLGVDMLVDHIADRFGLEDEVDRLLDRFAGLSPDLLRAVGADHLPEPPIHLVRQ